MGSPCPHPPLPVPALTSGPAHRAERGRDLQGEHGKNQPRARPGNGERPNLGKRLREPSGPRPGAPNPSFEAPPQPGQGPTEGPSGLHPAPVPPSRSRCPLRRPDPGLPAPVPVPGPTHGPAPPSRPQPLRQPLCARCHPLKPPASARSAPHGEPAGKPGAWRRGSAGGRAKNVGGRPKKIIK